MVWENYSFLKHNFSICTIGFKENRQDFPFYFCKLSYNFIEMHLKWTFQGKITLSKTILNILQISEQCQRCRDQIQVFFANRESIFEFNLSNWWVFDMHVSDFPSFAPSLLERTLTNMSIEQCHCKDTRTK